MLSTVYQPPQSDSGSENGHNEISAVVVGCAVDRLEEHPCFHGRSDAVQLRFDQGTIILSGRVPSFYLKQLLQEALRNIDGVERIDNRVDVACSNGLSSTRQRDLNPGRRDLGRYVMARGTGQ